MTDHTGVYVAGKELTAEQLRDYVQVLRKRLNHRKARGLDDTFTSRAMRDGIKDYEEILERISACTGMRLFILS